MKRMIFTLITIFSLLILLLNLQSCKQNISAKESKNEGIIWPEGQILPQCTAPAKVLDGLDIADKNLAPAERMLFSCLQGIINKKQPRIFLYDEGREKKCNWVDSLGLTISEYIVENRWGIIKKYEKELSGVVLYNPAKSLHYRNIATSISGIRNAIPVTEKELYELYDNNIVLPVIEDISELSYTTPADIYTYFYRKYWPECNHRMLISLSPERTGYVRDYGAASQSAVLYLDQKKKNEETVLRMFLNDMKGEVSIMLTCQENESSNKSIYAEYGILTIPADNTGNRTVRNER